MAEAVEPRPRTMGGGERSQGGGRPSGPAQSGLRMGRVAGVEIRVDWSLAIIFWLIVVNLGAGLFPSLHPQWSPALRWGVALVAAVLFFLSILAHELAHAIVGRARGVPVEGITLFMFGGVARLAGEPRSAGTEFWMAVVGPVTSFVIALVCGAAGLALAGVPGGQIAPAALRPAATVLLWLGSTNFALAVFNLLPGFPLDGGRVLRAILWKATGDVRRATRAASLVGRAIAFLLIFMGVMMAFGTRFPLLGGGLGQGIWLVLIGWFLDNAAMASYRQLLMNEMLSGLTVARLMRTDVAAVRPELSVSDLVDRHFMKGDQRCFPVVEGERLSGIVCMADLRKIKRDEWDRTPVRALMTPADNLQAARPDEDVSEALGRLTSRDVDQLPVLDEGRLVGMLRRADVLRWMELQSGR